LLLTYFFHIFNRDAVTDVIYHNHYLP